MSKDVNNIRGVSRKVGKENGLPSVPSWSMSPSPAIVLPKALLEESSGGGLMICTAVGVNAVVLGRRRC